MGIAWRIRWHQGFECIVLSLTLCALMLPVGTQLATAADYPGPNNALARAKANYEERNFDQAVVNMNEVIGSDATNPKAYLLRGKAFFNVGKFQLAIADFNKVLQYAPNDFAAFLWRGSAQAKLGDNDSAGKDYEQAIRLNPRLAKRFFAKVPEGQREQVSNIERFHLPGVSPENLKSPLIKDYKQAMAKVYPDGLSSNPTNPEPAAEPISDEEDSSYVQEVKGQRRGSDKR